MLPLLLRPSWVSSKGLLGFWVSKGGTFDKAESFDSPWAIGSSGEWLPRRAQQRIVCLDISNWCIYLLLLKSHWNMENFEKSIWYPNFLLVKPGVSGRPVMCRQSLMLWSRSLRAEMWGNDHVDCQWGEWKDWSECTEAGAHLWSLRWDPQETHIHMAGQNLLGTLLGMITYPLVFFFQAFWLVPGLRGFWSTTIFSTAFAFQLRC